jgi:hypothetical protein
MRRMPNGCHHTATLKCLIINSQTSFSLSLSLEKVCQKYNFPTQHTLLRHIDVEERNGVSHLEAMEVELRNWILGSIFMAHFPVIPFPLLTLNLWMGIPIINSRRIFHWKWESFKVLIQEKKQFRKEPHHQLLHESLRPSSTWETKRTGRKMGFANKICSETERRQLLLDVSTLWTLRH